MTYSSYSELQKNFLQEGDGVIFRLETGEVLNYEVYIGGFGKLFLGTNYVYNCIVFVKLKLDKVSFCEEHYGYEVDPETGFPEAAPNDYAALTRVTLALFDLIETPQKLAETSEILFID